MKIKDFIKKRNKDQFEINNSLFYFDNKPFTLTESTPKNWKYKFLTIDFNNGDYRHIDLDWLLLVLIEFYGKEYMIESIQKYKTYDQLKDIEMPLEMIEKLKKERIQHFQGKHYE